MIALLNLICSCQWRICMRTYELRDRDKCRLLCILYEIGQL